MKKADKDKWRFKVNESVENTGYKVKEQLGRGAVAEAYLVVRDRKDFVLKISALKNLAAGSDHFIAGINTSLQGEAAIMRALASVQAVPKLYDGESSVLSDDLFYIVTEYVTPEYQNLVNLCQQNPSEEDLFPLIEEILKFFVDLHALGYEYCDVKPDHFYWNPQNLARPLLVIDYNLSRKRQKPSGDSVRLRWVMSDLRRLGQVLFRSLLMGQEIVPELPGASRPIPFEGDTLYDLFLPTSFGNDQSGHLRLDWYLRRLHSGKYGTAQDALYEFEQLISGELDLESISQADYEYVESRVSYWLSAKPDWDEIENCWGRLGEVYLSSTDELTLQDELAVYVYLWGVGLAYRDNSKQTKPIGLVMLESLQKSITISDKDLQISQILIFFEEWRRSVSDPAMNKKRAWKFAIESFVDGYDKALSSLENYFKVYGQEGSTIDDWRAYISQSRASLTIWTYGIPQSYQVLAEQCFSSLNTKEEDVHLEDVKRLYKEHIRARKEICKNLLLDKPNREDIDNKFNDLQKIEDDIFKNIERLLLPDKAVSIWVDKKLIMLKVDEVINLINNNEIKINTWKDQFLEKTNDLFKLMGLDTDE